MVGVDPGGRSLGKGTTQVPEPGKTAVTRVDGAPYVERSAALDLGKARGKALDDEGVAE